MRLRLRLPEVHPDEYEIPHTCPYGCGGSYFALHQRWHKAVADPDYSEVIVRRYKCVKCGRSFRVHPTGISADHRSQRLRGIGVMLYALGLSYGGVADALAALGWPGSKSSIYRDVQAAGAAVQRLRQQQAVRRVRVASADATYVICQGEQVTVAVALDAVAGDVLEVDLVDGESVEALRPFLKQLQTEFGIEALISDDQESYKVLSDELALDHGVCRAHVNRNVADLVAQLGEQLLHLPQPVVPNVERTVADALADLEYVQHLIALRPPDGLDQLSRLLKHYQTASPPRPGEKASVAYRIRLALLRWSNNWPRLTFDQRWNRYHQTSLDGTNNVAERAIGWYIKERYRTMRTYKRRASVRNICRLIPYLAAHPDQPVLADLLAA
jgi:transposase-like protein